MPKVLCKLLNASDYISGVKFVSHQDGMLSEEISDEAAAAFLEVPGYELATPVKTAAAAAAEVVATKPTEEPVSVAEPEVTAPAEADANTPEQPAEQSQEEAPAAEVVAAAEAEPVTAEPTEVEAAAAAAAQKAADKKAAKQAAAAAAKA